MIAPVEEVMSALKREARMVGKDARYAASAPVSTRSQEPIEFELTPELEAHEPPEGRGLRRDEVRLMISRIGDDAIMHTRFDALPDYLDAGDLVVINTSGTLPASVPAMRVDGSAVELHLSTELPDGRWVVELRRLAERGTIPLGDGATGERLMMPAGGRVTLLEPKIRNGATPIPSASAGMHRKGASDGVRLWIAKLELPASLHDYLAVHGAPIRYGYIDRPWPIEYYQTIYATAPGSAEMPSAGRAFTAELITKLVAKGVMVAPIVLHTGVASLEDHEPPYEEYYHVPESTARLVNLARFEGKRIVAVGTTVVRALESATDEDGWTSGGTGWTDLVITPHRPMRAVTALLTGLHEPRATHLAMLEALAGRDHLRIAYREALHERYLWHEFGDLHLILR